MLTVEKNNAYPVIVICPAFLKINWKKEYRKWLDKDLKITIIEGETNKEIPKSDVYIINYSILHHNIKLLKELELNSIIIDEIHYCSNHKSIRTKTIKDLVNTTNPKIRLGLSATPVKNKPKELIPQLEILGKLEEMGGFWNFTGRYCRRRKTEFGINIDGKSNLEELHNRLRSVGYIRRKKSQVLEELPPVNRVQIPVEIDNRNDYNKAKEDIIQWIEDNEGKEKAMRALYAETMVRISKLRELTAKGKLKNSIRWIKEFLDTGEKLIVFAHHKSITDKVAEEFNCLKITGKVSDKDKEKAVEKFQNDEEEQLIVISLQAGSEGLTLTASSNIVFLEMGWTSVMNDQAEGRAYGRLNDVHGLNSYYLVGENTIDEYMLRIIEEKREMTDKVIDGEHKEENKIRREVIGSILDYLMEQEE